MKTSEIGKQAEQATEAYLRRQGLTLKERNFSCKLGEIDLIMMDGEFLVFVEVRLRNNDDYANALESVTKSKQGKIRNTAKLYLQQENLYNKIPCRFDVVAASFRADCTPFEWIKNAFY